MFGSYDFYHDCELFKELYEQSQPIEDYKPRDIEDEECERADAARQDEY